MENNNIITISLQEYDTMRNFIRDVQNNDVYKFTVDSISEKLITYTSCNKEIQELNFNLLNYKQKYLFLKDRYKVALNN